MDIEKTVLEMAAKARKAGLALGNAAPEKKNSALLEMAKALRANSEKIIEANRGDLEKAEKDGLKGPMLERLALDEKKIDGMARGLEELSALPDSVGEIMESLERPNGLSIEKVRVPLGVIAIIYESRPNVTVDCAGLCLKSGNACILRGGSESFGTNMLLAGLISDALRKAGMPEDAVQIVPTTDRAALGALLKLDSLINCVIPRGGEALIRFVAQNSTIPVIKHYKGVCTVFIDEFAGEELAVKITIDAKCQRPSVCNAAENLLVHEKAPELLAAAARKLIENGVELRAGRKAKKILDAAGIESKSAIFPDDFEEEYTDLIIAVDLVGSVEEAADFINRHGSAHSDCIVTQSAENAELFMNLVDSSTVYWNASTRFTDGFEFGMGAEIGISTDKLHARGPMGLKELSIYKYKVRGTGQTKAPAK